MQGAVPDDMDILKAIIDKTPLFPNCKSFTCKWCGKDKRGAFYKSKKRECKRCRKFQQYMQNNTYLEEAWVYPNGKLCYFCKRPNAKHVVVQEDEDRYCCIQPCYRNRVYKDGKELNGKKPIVKGGFGWESFVVEEKSKSITPELNNRDSENKEDELEFLEGFLKVMEEQRKLPEKERLLF